jgi:small subunit ribosomal protein S2
MASLVKQLVEAGIHFGHRASHWNPKMEPYIFGKRNKIHVIDVKETVKGLLRARKFITRTVANGKDVLFVGTKRQAREIIQRHADDCGMHYITERWLGGTLTNFRTIRERLKRLEELERLEASGELESYSKKMESQLKREKRKIDTNLGGLRNMNKLPGALVVVDVRHEQNAVREAKKLGIPTVALIDTDSDPDFADIPIPGNDDAMRAIEVIVGNLAAAVQEGKQQRQPEKAGGQQQAQGESLSQRRRRSGQVQYTADADAAHAGGESQPADQAEQSAEGEASASAASGPQPDQPVTSAVGDDASQRNANAG